MKSILILLGLLSLFVLPLSSATPTIDGSFDGESIWGAPAATADGITGWAGVNVDKIYVTYDANYAYFAAAFYADGYPQGWMRVAFAINVKADGGWNCPWGQAVSYTYLPDDQKPDFVPIGRLQDNWAELRDWNGTGWGGEGTNIMDNGDMAWAADYSYLECRISKTVLGSVDLCDVQFYVSGDNDTEHGVFDACPDDEVMTSWNDPTSLDNYVLDVQIGDPSAIEEAQDNLPLLFLLEQNYPNPFNPVTTIRYSIADAAPVELTVYNTLGQKVETLVNTVKEPGHYRVSFDAQNLPNGLYFYQLRSGRLQQIRKMILIK